MQKSGKCYLVWVRETYRECLLDQNVLPGAVSRGTDESEVISVAKWHDQMLGCKVILFTLFCTDHSKGSDGIKMFPDRIPRIQCDQAALNIRFHAFACTVLLNVVVSTRL